MRGRKPKPTHQKVLEGNPGKRRLNRQEPPLPPEPFEQLPAELARNPRARAEWRRLAPILRARRAVTVGDRAALIALCLEWSRYLIAESRATRMMTFKTKSGYPMPNPYLGIASRALAACARLWPELGLTPSSRSRVRVDTPPGDEFAEFDEPPPPRPTTH
jgi:P27 family predicted phage terminase small subunit